MGKRVMGMEVEGVRGRGRPKRRWMECVREDMERKGLTEEDALDRVEWIGRVRNTDPT